MDLEATDARWTEHLRELGSARPRLSSAADRIAAAHALFLVGFGAWPNVHMRSFEAVTGKKREPWLVRAIGLLLVTSGSAIALARREGSLSSSTRLLAVGVSASLGAISLRYASSGRISPVYFLDGALHAGFVAAWLSTLPSHRTRRSVPCASTT